MTEAIFTIGTTAKIPIGGDAPLGIICGPCVIESRDHALRHAEKIKALVSQAGLPLIFKSSYDKANRTSGKSFRGIGIDQGLKILGEIKQNFEMPVLTDVHSVSEVEQASDVVDVLQIPAFLCRQTDLLAAAGSSGLAVMIKKGQFLCPADMQFAVSKVNAAGGKQVMVCERGTCFGYRDLVVDFRSLAIMSKFGCPVIFDATHSVQSIGGGTGVSGGDRQYVPVLARAAVACGVDGVFLECHENPSAAPSDGMTMIALGELAPLLSDLKKLDELLLETRKY